jgi:membrane protease subunit (stomatin/prohibitin family)
MGLIKAVVGSVSGELANQWKDFYVCDSMSGGTLIKRAQKKESRRSSNKHGDQDVITKGSALIVNAGQCAILVDSGKVIDIAAEPGAYEWEDNGSASVFAGDFVDIFKELGRRFTFGGEKPVQQRIYFVNTKEIIGLKFGTPTPIPFRIVDKNVGLDFDTKLRCNGNFSIHISDPTQIYGCLAGNVKDEYTVEDLSEQIRALFVQALQPAVSQLSGLEIRPSALPGHTKEISEAMKNEVNETWTKQFGIEISSVQIVGADIPEEDQATLNELQKAGALRNQSMAGATLVAAQAEAMKAAANNPNGAAMGLFGMNMAMQAGGANANELLQAGAAAGAASNASQATDRWFCPQCGNENHGNFCTNCGTKRP